MGGDRGSGSEVLNELALVTAMVAAPVSIITFFFAAAFDERAACVLAGGSALCAIFCLPAGRPWLRGWAVFTAWLGLVVAIVSLWVTD